MRASKVRPGAAVRILRDMAYDDGRRVQRGDLGVMEHYDDYANVYETRFNPGFIVLCAADEIEEI